MQLFDLPFMVLDDSALAQLMNKTCQILVNIQFFSVNLKSRPVRPIRCIEVR